MTEQAEYFRRRAKAERAAAAESADDAIRGIHLEMAEAYERLAALRTEWLGRENEASQD